MKKSANLFTMKAKNIFETILILIAFTVFYGCSNTRKIKAEPPLDSVAVRNMIDSQSFVFLARFVTPMTGRRRDLTAGYELSISKDTLISYLPFFGRGYTAPISPSDVDFDFTSTKFTYTVIPARKGWNISIKTKDQTFFREMYLRIFDNAAASLNITSIDRSTISYDGYITRRKSKEK